jgi:hypothetical protein
MLHAISLLFDDLVFTFDLEKTNVIFVGEDLLVEIFRKF